MFKGDLGKVRKVLTQIGMNSDKIMFNDKRKTFRRIKIWNFDKKMTKKFQEAIAKEFGDRYITSKAFDSTIYGRYDRKAFAIYLSN